MHNRLSSSSPLVQIAQNLQQEAGAKSWVHDATLGELVFELKNVGSTVVQDSATVTRVDPQLMICPYFENLRIGSERLKEGMTIEDFVRETRSHLNNYSLPEADSAWFIISWAGQNEHPFGVKIGNYTLATLDNGNVCDINGRTIGLYDHLADDNSKGFAILVVLPKNSLS